MLPPYAKQAHSLAVDNTGGGGRGEGKRYYSSAVNEREAKQNAQLINGTLDASILTQRRKPHHRICLVYCPPRTVTETPRKTSGCRQEPAHAMLYVRRRVGIIIKESRRAKSGKMQVVFVSRSILPSEMLLRILLTRFCRFSDLLADDLPFALVVLFDRGKKGGALVFREFGIVHVLVPVLLDTTLCPLREGLCDLAPRVPLVPHLLEPLLFSRRPRRICPTLLRLGLHRLCFNGRCSGRAFRSGRCGGRFARGHLFLR